MYLIFFILHGSNKPKNNLNIEVDKKLSGAERNRVTFCTVYQCCIFFFIVYIIPISDIAHISIEYLISALL